MMLAVGVEDIPQEAPYSFRRHSGQKGEMYTAN